jgi:hypothetical protein
MISPACGDEVARLRARARSGFLKGTLKTLLSTEGLENIQPHVRCAIENMFGQAARA